MPLLPHVGLGRRRDVARLTLRHILGVDSGEVPPNPLTELLADPGLPNGSATSLLGLLYCVHTELVREAVQDLYLPILDDDLRVGETVAPADWYGWLEQHLNSCSENSLKRTRQTQVTMLAKFGYIEGTREHRPVRRRPETAVFAAAVVLDYQRHGWRTRGAEYVLGPTGPRCLSMVTREYASHCLAWADNMGLLRRVRVGSDTDFSLPNGDVLAMIAEVIRRAA